MPSRQKARVASCWWSLAIFFFFQAEDGIRGLDVTGVQTCALPIFGALLGIELPPARLAGAGSDLPGRVAEIVDEAYEAKERELGPELMREIERLVLLRAIDTHWVEHLTQMEELREGIYLRGYGQQDPLIA